MDVTTDTAWVGDPGIRVLHRATHALNAARSPDEVAAQAADLAIDALGAGADARISFANPAGRLVPGRARGPWPTSGRAHTALRRRVFRTGTAASVSLGEPSGRAVGLLPLVSDEDAFGILEAVADENALLDAWDVLEVLAAQAAVGLSSVRARERARREADGRLDDGLAWTAHELRGPLLGVKAALELMQRDERTSAALVATLRRSERELGRLAGIADGLLRWAAGAEPLRRRWTDLTGIVGDAIESCRLEAGEGSVELDALAPVTARVDPSHVHVAVANLVRNALACSPDGTDVLVGVTSRGDIAEIRVTDQGPGVRPDERDRIFDPFVRGDAGRSRRAEGRGLGLFIARRIVEAHGGRIEVGALANGCTFTARLPLDDDVPDGDRRAGVWSGR